MPHRRFIGTRIKFVLYATIVASSFSVPRVSYAIEPGKSESGPNWKLLRFEWFDDSRVIKKVTLRLQDFKNLKPVTTLEVESADPLVLKRIQRGLMFAFRFAAPSGAAGADVQFAEVEIATNRETFKVGVGDTFTLPSESTSTEHAFFSWTLAKTVDDLQFSRTGRRMSDDRIKSLSGEATIASQKVRYERENADQTTKPIE